MYKKYEHIHFMGIGGIGVSAIAEIVRRQGYPVSGCDTATTSSVVQHLQSLGCIIMQGHSCDHITDVDVLVYSSAVKKDNPEILAALNKGIPVISRAIMLAELMRTKFSVAVAGMHGKTTTTSLISHILLSAQRNPTVVIGGKLKNIGNNAHMGSSDLLIAEADESDRSLLYLNPTMAIVTNINPEHLDVYKDIEDIKQTFKDFLARLPFYGKAVVCIDDQNIQSILPLVHVNTIKYGMSTRADVMAHNLDLQPLSSSFDLYVAQKFVCRMSINIPGQHNVLNALAAIVICRELDVAYEDIAIGLASFGGVERRFEYKGRLCGALVYDDYGHHPVEIQKTLLVAQRLKKQKLHVLFQPHRYSRTEKLWDDFVQLFSDYPDYQVDTIIMTDIYPASEQPIPHITTQRLIAAIMLKNPNALIYYASDHDAIASLLVPRLSPDDIVLTLGAGRMNVVGEQLIKAHQ